MAGNPFDQFDAGTAAIAPPVPTAVALQPQANPFDQFGNSGALPPDLMANLSPEQQQLAQAMPATMRPVAVRAQHAALPFLQRMGQDVTDMGRVAADQLSFRQAPTGIPLKGPNGTDLQELNQSPLAQSPQDIADAGSRLEWLDPTARTAASLLPASMITGGVGAAANTLKGIPYLGTAARALVMPVSGAAYGTADAQRTGQPMLPGAATGAVGGAVGGLVGAGTSAGVNGLAEAYANAKLPPEIQQIYPTVGKAINWDNPAIVQNKLATLGPNGMILDTGPGSLGLASGLATKNGPAASILTDALEARRLGTNGRVNNDVASSIGVPSQTPQALTDALNAQRSTVNSQLPGVYAGVPSVDTSDVLQYIGSGLNTAKGAQAAALQKARSMLMNEGPNGAVPETNPQAVGNAKIAVNDLIKYGDPSLGVPSGALSQAQGAAKIVRAKLNDALRSQVPGYGPLMDQSSAIARQMEALQDGTTALRPGTPTFPQDFAAKWAQMSPEEQNAMRSGMASSVQGSMGIRPNDAQAIKSVLQGENGYNAQNIGTAFGPDAQKTLENAVNREGTFAGSQQDVLRNSMTARRTAMEKAVADQEQNDMIPHHPNLTWEGIVSTIGTKPLNMAINALRGPIDNGARDMAMAKALTVGGPERDALVSQLVGALNRGPNIGQKIAGPAGQILARAIMGGSSLAAPAAASLLGYNSVSGAQ